MKSTNEDTEDVVMDHIVVHYNQHHDGLVKLMGFRAGTKWAGEDVVQEAYARAIRYRETCDLDRFDRWFATILKNCLRDMKREDEGRSVTVRDDEDILIDCGMLKRETCREVVKEIDAMSPVQKEVLYLFFLQGYQPIDIAQITEYSYQQVHQIIQRFKKKLEEKYKD